MISPKSIEQIKARIDILDVLGDFVPLKKRGSNYIGNCPFHNERTPSFTVSPTKEFYKCFGCGKSGNTITFLMEHEKLSYVETLRWLATRYQIEIEETESSPEQQLLQQTGESLHIINKFAQQFFEEQLFNTEEGKINALSYLQERGFRELTIKKFQIGYNPTSRNSLAKVLLQQQFNQELLPRTGLVVLRNEEWVDNYRERIIFPIHGYTGKIVGFGARIIGKATNAPKYINTPENEIYSKGKLLYGLYQARNEIQKTNECLLVEGYTDVVTLHQAGIENVVASGGTALTTDQLRLIKKYTHQLTIIYDGDTAGINAAMRGLDMALEEGLNVKMVLIPDNEDPDSYVYKIGTEAFRTFIEKNKKDFVLFQLEVKMKAATNDPNAKNEIVNQIANTISKINTADNFAKQQEYIKQCAALLKIDEAGLLHLVNQFREKTIAKARQKEHFEANLPTVVSEQESIENDKTETANEVDYLLNKEARYERNIIRVLLESGLKMWDENTTIADFIFEQIKGFPFVNKPVTELLATYKDRYSKGLQPSDTNFIQETDPNFTLFVEIIMQPFEESPNWDKVLNKKVLNKNVSREDAMSSILYFKLQKLKTMIALNANDIEHAEEDDITRLLTIHKQLKEYEQQIAKKLGSVVFK